MPKIFLTNPEKYENVTRPVVMGMIRQIMLLSGLPANTKIQYSGTHNQAMQNETSLTGGDDTVAWPNAAKITVSIEEDFAEDRLSGQVMHRPQHLFVFNDPALEVYIKPVYSTTRVQVNFQCRAVDDVSAKRWRDDFKTRLCEGRDAQLFDAVYSYPIPLELLVILEEIWRLRETVAPYGETLDTYFMNHADPRMSVLVNQAGEGGLISISETQGEIVGVFDFTGVPEKGDREGDNENWTINLPFTFMYDQPVGCDMNYPLVIHQQMIKYRPSAADKPDKLIQRAQVRSAMSKNMSVFETGAKTYRNRGAQGVSIPSYDEFIPASIVSSTARVFEALTAISATDLRSLLNLKDVMPEYVFDPKILKFLTAEAPFMTRPYRSIFQLSLYRGYNLQLPSMLNIDTDLNVTATQDLNLRDYHHVRLSVVYDLSLLDQAAKDRIKENGCAFAMIVYALDPRIKPPALIGDCYCPGSEIDRITDALNPVGGNGQIIQFNTVETLYLESHKGNVNANS